MLYFIYNTSLFTYIILLTKVMYSYLYLFLVICQWMSLTLFFICLFVCVCVCVELQRASKRQEDEGMRRWREHERWPVEPFCHDWKRQWALTSVGGFGLSSCLLVRPCGIKESKMNTLTHFPPFLPVLLPRLSPYLSSLSTDLYLFLRSDVQR